MENVISKQLKEFGEYWLPGNSKISQFYCQFSIHLRQEDVLRFDVSVEDLPVVDMLDRQANLYKPVQNLGNGDRYHNDMKVRQYKTSAAAV